MTHLVNTVFGCFALISWLLGFVIAQGFWSTLACVFPFYAWYLVILHFSKMLGIV